VLSLVTLVRNRNALLASLLHAVATGSSLPAEVVVVRAGGHEDPGRVVPPPLTDRVRIIEVESPTDRIPYSEARNAGAGASTAAHVVFLDADCIPSPTFVAAMDEALSDHDALCTGDVRYLPPTPLHDRSPEHLTAVARPHPHRPVFPDRGVVLDDRHELVWGLCMGWRRATFSALGGFDTSYQGYAGEDTDLAVAARSQGVPVGLVGGATVFHQHHDVYEPPVQQFEATLANARRFRDKWGRWPMEGWLEGFRDLGLIDWSPDHPEVRVLRFPTAADVSAARRTSALPFRQEGPGSTGATAGTP
jgi:GT2 family glycosyltransferase